MWGKRFELVVGIMAMVLMVAGCGRPATQKKNEAQEQAVSFYRAFYLGGDLSGAWEMTVPGLWDDTFGSKEEFLKAHSELKRDVPADAELQVEEYDRAGDFLYLISDSRHRRLVWVTKTQTGWKVRDFTDYGGGPIPWSRGG